MNLFLEIPTYYRVKKGQKLTDIAKTFRLPPRLLAARNALTAEVFEGQVLLIPEREGNLYVVRGGESKVLLCGSAENFERKNGTKCLYVGQTVII